MVITFGCCVGDWGRFERNVLPATAGHEVIALSEQGSIATAYNKILAMVRRFGTSDVLVLLHDDLEIVDDQAIAKIEDAAHTFHITGVIGAPRAATPQLAWWLSGLVGRQVTDSGPLAGEQAGQASAVDGSIMILSTWFLLHSKLWFDESYPGFHGYDVDMCRRIMTTLPDGPPRAAGVGVVDLATHHHSTLGWKSPEVQEAWQQADRLFQLTWGTS